MTNNPVPHKWSVDEYMAYQEGTGIKHEYVDGEIYAMSGGTENHSLVATNTIAELSIQLRGSSCRVHSSDMQIKVGDLKYLYPDLSVICGKSIFADESHTLLANPTLVCEVMSPSSENYDKGLKGEFYRSLSSLKYYLVLSQNRVYAQLYSLRDDGWLLQEFTKRDDVLSLDMIGVKLPLSEIYRDIEFE